MATRRIDEKPVPIIADRHAEMISHAFMPVEMSGNPKRRGKIDAKTPILSV